MIRRITRPFLDLLRQGITPEKIALTIAVGLALGVTPVIGSTTLLCTLAAAALGLNLPAIQLVNGLTYPLQLVLIIPFLKAGAWLFSAPLPSLTVASLFGEIRIGVWHAITTLWGATMHALVAWLICSTLAAALIYLATLPLLRRAASISAKNPRWGGLQPVKSNKSALAGEAACPTQRSDLQERR